jgi:hypothetical protein
VQIGDQVSAISTEEQPDGSTVDKFAWDDVETPVGLKNPVYLGGHAYVNRRGEHAGGFLGNVANLGLFDDAIDGAAIDCLYRQVSRGS